MLRAGAHGNTWASVGPIRVRNLKAIRALESVYNRYPHLPWALWENRKYHNCGPGRAHNDNFHTRVSSFIGQHYGKKLACCPQQELRTMHPEVFTPHPLMPSKFEKMRPSRKAPEPIAK